MLDEPDSLNPSRRIAAGGAGRGGNGARPSDLAISHTALRIGQLNAQRGVTNGHRGFTPKNKEEVGAPRLFVSVLSQFCFLTLAVYLVLLYLKANNNVSSEVHWSHIHIPIYFTAAFAVACVLSLVHMEGDLETIIVAMAYVTTLTLALMFALQFVLLGLYLDEYSSFSISVVLIPGYIAVFFALLFYLFILPGLLDPESQVPRRVPFMALVYILATTAFLVLLNVHSAEKDSSVNYYQVFAPFLSASALHTFLLIFDLRRVLWEISFTSGFLLLVVLLMLHLEDVGHLPLWSVYIPLVFLLLLVYASTMLSRKESSTKDRSSVLRL